MNRILLSILLLIFFYPQFTNSQSDYWTQTNGPHTGTVHDYSFGENNIVYAAADNGVYKSLDNGVSWNSIGFLGTQIWGICKTSLGSLLAGTVDEGLYRTTNEGINWTMVQFIGNYIYDVKEINSNLIIMACYNGVLKSTNNGINWTQTLSNVFATSIDTSSYNEIYVSTANSGIYKSTNSGNNWIQLNGSNFGQIFSVNVAINGFIFLTTWNGSIYRSTNNGLSFEDIGEKNQIYKTYMSVTTKDGYLYCGTFYQGIWSSSDFGNTWTKQYPGERYNFFVRKLCEGQNGNVFASVQYNAVIKTTDQGGHWNGFRYNTSFRYADILLPSADAKIFSNNGLISEDGGFNWMYADYEFDPSYYARNISTNTIFATDASTNSWKVGGVYRSTDNGSNWDFINLNNLGAGFYNLYVSKIGDVYMNGSGLIKSTNDGLNWFQISDHSFFELASGETDVLFGKRGGATSGVYRSTNHGQDWEYVLPLTNNTNNDGKMYVTNSGEVYAGGNNTLYKSTNNGNNWIQENITGLVTSIMENQNGRLFISTNSNGRVYMKEGDSLTDITYNLNGRTIYTMCFNSDGKLLAGTDQGVFISNQQLIGINNLNQNIPDKYILYQNYPNPFNPVTHLEFGISKPEFVSLKVYDILGNEVADLVNEKKHPGNYEVEFNGGNLASGIYYYKIIAGSFTQTKKMMLLK